MSLTFWHFSFLFSATKQKRSRCLVVSCFSLFFFFFVKQCDNIYSHVCVLSVDSWCSYKVDLKPSPAFFFPRVSTLFHNFYLQSTILILVYLLLNLVILTIILEFQFQTPDLLYPHWLIVIVFNKRVKWSNFGIVCSWGLIFFSFFV